MPESTLSITYSELLVIVGTFLGYDADPTTWDSLQMTEVDSYIQSGIRQFYYPPSMQGIDAGYEWSFLSPTATIDTVADTAAQDLPDDLARVMGDFFYSDELHKNSIVQVSEAQLLANLQRSTDTNYPKIATVRHKTSDGSDGQRLEVAWYPIPNSAYTLTYRYEAYQGKLVAGTNEYPLGGMKYSELITESCLSIAEQRANDEEGLHTGLFFRLLKTGIEQDRKQGARYYGAMGQGAESVMRLNRADGDITYKNVTW
jgi:hypothetical protein